MTGTPGTSRLARAAVFGVSSACLALAAHVAAGGERPPALLVAAGAGLLTRVAYGLADRERALGQILGAVLAAQATLHTAFVLATHHPPGAGGAGSAPTAVAVVGPGVGEHLAASLFPGGSMVAGHACAASCVAVLLHRCERRLWSTAALRLAVERAVTAVARMTSSVLARLRAAGRIVPLAAAARPRVAAAPVTSMPGRVAGGGAGPGIRWHAHVLLLGTDAARRGPPTRRPGSSLRPAL
ncbi:hypothetical protein MXD62_12045 [Frankia sp. Mgl5]|uniref:hypothetical protein n=1 Tax=Frankia sp. Mgl5 TaxID=2933793 RepID=UPI00200E223E|nr:hypothetical protein [Frankia sp. Mgl5]MCK9927895.1 hypothetical protein [Frankia sp. Mgl5]